MDNIASGKGDIQKLNQILIHQIHERTESRRGQNHNHSKKKRGGNQSGKNGEEKTLHGKEMGWNRTMDKNKIKNKKRSMHILQKQILLRVQRNNRRQREMHRE